jgi:hypothetical protein
MPNDGTNLYCRGLRAALPADAQRSDFCESMRCWQHRTEFVSRLPAPSRNRYGSRIRRESFLTGDLAISTPPSPAASTPSTPCDVAIWHEAGNPGGPRNDGAWARRALNVEIGARFSMPLISAKFRTRCRVPMQMTLSRRPTNHIHIVANQLISISFGLTVRKSLSTISKLPA